MATTLNCVTSEPRSVAEAGDQPVLNLALFAELRELDADPDSDGLLRRMVTRFVEHMRPDLDALREALARMDARTVREIAHSIAGSGGQLGAVQLVEVCRRVEAAADTGDLSAVPHLVDVLEERYRVARIAVAAEFAHGH